MKNIGKIFSENLKQCRKKSKLTQEKLAELCDVSIITVQSWENQRYWPKAESIDTLAKVLEISPNMLFMDSETKQSPVEALATLNEYFTLRRSNKSLLEAIPQDLLQDIEKLASDPNSEKALRTHVQALVSAYLEKQEKKQRA